MCAYTFLSLVDDLLLTSVHIKYWYSDLDRAIDLTQSSFLYLTLLHFTSKLYKRNMKQGNRREIS